MKTDIKPHWMAAHARLKNEFTEDVSMQNYTKLSVICHPVPSLPVSLCEPRHDKMCLKEFPTRPDTNRPAQPQKLARVLEFWL